MLITIKHRSGEYFKVDEGDLVGNDEDLIPLYEMDGTRRSRADAWFGSGRPSDIRRGDARNGYVEAGGMTP